MWRKVELLSLVENQEEPVHYVEDYEHPREGFQKELVNPKINTISNAFKWSVSIGHFY